MYQSATQQGFN